MYCDIYVDGDWFHRLEEEKRVESDVCTKFVVVEKWDISVQKKWVGVVGGGDQLVVIALSLVSLMVIVAQLFHHIWIAFSDSPTLSFISYTIHNIY